VLRAPLDLSEKLADQIDAENRIVAVSELWDRFAPPSVYRSQVIERSLWDFLAGTETRDSFRKFDSVELPGVSHKICPYPRQGVTDGFRVAGGKTSS
jgi:hypothetical protein